MGFFSDIMGTISSLITAKGNVAEFKYKHKLSVKEDRRFRKGQWDRLFCSQDYNAIKLLRRFIDNNNAWIEIDDSLYNSLSSDVFCGRYKYNEVCIYYKNVEFTLFQKYHTEEDIEYIRIAPKIYPEFQKQYNLYQKKGMI